MEAYSNEWEGVPCRLILTPCLPRPPFLSFNRLVYIPLHRENSANGRHGTIMLQLRQIIKGRTGQYTITKQLQESVWLATYVLLVD